MKYSCLIIEDNQIERDLIASCLSRFEQLCIVDTCENGLQALELLRNISVDIVFSDINMPLLSGIELFKNLKNPPAFIFVTSHLEHAVESFELNALDFIPKPVKMERLVKSINKATDYIDLKRKVGNDSLIETAKGESGIFFIKETKGYTRLNYDKIVYIESLGDFSKLFTSCGVHVTLINLKNLEQQLPNYFFRVHKQYIINFNKIVSVTPHEIFLENDFKVPLSPFYRDQVINLINNKTLIRSIKKSIV